MQAPLGPGSLVLGRYKIKDVLRPRLLSWAYRAYDREIEVDVQLDTLHGELTPTAGAQQQILVATRKVARLTHRNVRRIFEAHVAPPGAGWTVAVASQLVEATPLQIGMRPPRGLDELPPLAGQLGEALVAVHALGLAHGALRPDEISVLADVVKVGGAGLAAALDRPALLRALQAGGVNGGELRYLSPEVLGGGPLDERADLYAFAMIMLEQAIGQTVDDVRLALPVLEERAPRLRRVLEGALADDPAGRDRSAANFALAITEAVRVDAQKTRKVPMPTSRDLTPMLQRERDALDDDVTLDFERVDPAIADPDFPLDGDGDGEVTNPPQDSGPIGRARNGGAGAPRVVFTSSENSPPPAPEPVPRPFSTTLRSGGAPPPASVPPPPPASQRLHTTPATPAKLQPRAQLAAPPLPIPAPKLTPPIAQPALRHVPVAVPGPTQPQRVAVPIAPAWPPVEPRRLPTMEAELPPLESRRLPTMEAELPPAASLPGLHLPHEQPEVPTIPVPHQPKAPQWPLEPELRPVALPGPSPSRVAASTRSGLRDAGPEQRVATLPVSGRGPRPKAAERRSVAPLLLTMALLAGAIAAAIYVARMYITGSSKKARNNALPSASTSPSTSTSPSPSTSPSTSTSPSPSPSPSTSPTPSASPSPTIAAVTPDAGAPVPGGPIVTHPIDSGPCPAGALLIAGKPKLCVDSHEAPGAGKLPTTGITFSDAARACTQRGMRLCEGEEFERACRGHHKSSYPYGSSFSASRCNAERSGHKQPVPTGSLPECLSEAGMFDMAGNVAEWVSEGKIAGGSFDDGDGRCSKRFSRDKGRGHDDVGYRCCSDPR